MSDVDDGPAAAHPTADLADPADGAAPAAAFLSLLRASLADGSLRRLVLAKPRSRAGAAEESAPVKVSARLLKLKDQVVVSLVETHPTRDLTRNLRFDAAVLEVEGWLATRFQQAHLFIGEQEVQLLTSRRGRQTLLRGRRPAAGESSAEARAGGEARGAAGTAAVALAAPATATAPAPAPPTPNPTAAPPLAAHDRAKRRPIPLDRPYLQHLGVTDAQARLVPSMARKWKQINKFVEVLDHALGQAGSTPGDPPGAPLQVLDFGSGKGYLTFATHDHLRHTLGLAVRVTGVDLKADMIELCNRAAAAVGAEGLAFERGDVASHAPQRADVMIALHACDTATDHAIHAGLRAGARVIMCSPCCHKELRPQLLSPHPLRPILKHGIHLGQQAEMLTDGLRALLLEACGYDTQVFEFISPEQTSKNKMILAVKRPPASGRADEAAAVWQQIADLKAFYGIQAQCLETLLRADRSLPVAVRPATAADAPKDRFAPTA